MNHLFTPYDLAKKLKEKGFNEICHALIDEDNCIHPLNLTDEKSLEFDQQVSKYNDKECCPAPMFQQVSNWFRSEHNINIEVMTTGEDNKYPKWNYWLVNTKKSNRVELAMQELKEENPIEYSTYYQALTKGIEEALKLI